MSGGVSSVMGSGGVGGMVSRLLQQSENKQIRFNIPMAADIKNMVLWDVEQCA